MSDFSKNNNEQNAPADDTVSEATVTEKASALEETKDTEEESTIFSAPLEHKDKAPNKGSKKRIASIIAACLAVVILVSGTIAVIKLIPEMEEDEIASSVFEDITVVDADSDTFTTVNITNSNGEFKFITQEITAENDDGETEVTTYWGVEGVDISKLSNTTMTSIISSAASVTATREITSKTASECGLDDPIIKVEVEVDSDSSGSYAFSVGDESPDGLGYYLKLDGADTIYVASASEFSSFEFSLLDLADKTSIPVTTFTTDTSESKDDDGTYAYFDSLTISGKLFPDTVTIVNNSEDSDSAALVPYIVTTPMQRYANSDNISPAISLFSSETAVSGSYAFDITDETLKEFGLDDPDVVLSMTIDGESRTFKISKVDDDYCAVIYDGATMIRKVSADSFEFLDFTPEDYYYKNFFMYSINDITSFELKDSDGEVKFDISYEEDEDSVKTYHISVDGTEITASNFQDFYANFVGIQCSDFTVEETSEKAASQITFTFYDGSEILIEFYRVNETQYQCSINGIHMGRITSALYNKTVKNIRLVAQDNAPT